MARAWVWVLFGLLFSGSIARGDHFAIDLKVQAGKATKTAHAETAAIGVKPKLRAVLAAKAGDSLTIAWRLASTDPDNTYKDVVVHFFIVREEKLGQATVPPLDRDVPAESALTMDFKPKDTTEGELTVWIERAGAYLVRLETIGAAAGDEGHEHFAALDLEVQ